MSRMAGSSEEFEKLMASIRALTPEQCAEARRAAREAVEEGGRWLTLEGLADGLLASESFRADFLNPDTDQEDPA